MSVARTRIALTGHERFFGDDEIIVSKTDLTGRITYANHVFIAVSGYTEDELLGAPHSILRHPEMPRAVFRFLWERLLSGHEVFAYVVNLACNGDHYWVFAHITPSYARDGAMVGFHSNRRVPEATKLPAVRAIYAALLAEEQRHDDRAEGLAASYEVLGQTLASAGVTYDQWVWSL